MAAGDITQIGGAALSLSLLAAAIANTAAPTVVGDGVSLAGIDGMIGAQAPIPEAECRAWSSAGSGVMTARIRMWGWDPAAGKWFPMGIGMDDLKGQLNDAQDLGESDANQIVHTEIVRGVRRFTRFYPQVVDIQGTNTAINVALVIEK